MEETYLLSYPGVKKKILAGGKGPLPHFPPGTKVIFHFQTLLDNFERTVVDDSRLAGRPAEIFVGKMFKMEIWESLLTSMRVGEVAEFWCDAVHTGLYPIVSKGMRLIAQGKDPLEGQKHMCGMGNLFHYHSTGFPELDEIMRNPQPLIFIMELLQVGDPLSYHRESWMMEKDEKLQTVPALHMQGNALVRQKQFREAASKYKEAILLLKTVQSREMPGDVDYINLGRMIVPLELNYCQCMLELEEYYEVIEHTTELLEKHRDCVKGYYKRAKAHAAVWNEKEARRDFSTVAQLDMSLAALVRRELKELSERMKEKYWEEKEQYWNMLEKTEGASKQEEEEQQDEEEQKDEGAKQKESDFESGKAGEKTRSSEMKRVEEGEAGEEEVRPSEGAKEEESSRAVELQACDEMEGKDWQQMLRLVMFLQNEGNFLIKEQRFPDASAKFKEALGYVDFLQNKQVDQHGEDWESLEKVRLPLSLNLSQCMLELKQHQEVVELNSRLLKTHRGNFKATYQRARAHAALCNEDEARRDFATVEKLDPEFKPFVQKELKILGENIRKMHASQKKNYWEMTKEKWSPVGSRTKDAVRKKNANSAKKATEKNTEMDKNPDSHEVEEQESPAENRAVETEGAGDTEAETNPDLKAERRDKEQTCGRTSELGSDKENPARVAAPEAENYKTDKDGDPASTSSDNVVSRRSQHDKGKKKKKKVKRQSRNAAKRTKSVTGKGDGPVN